jgi:hypothetical protein
MASRPQIKFYSDSGRVLRVVELGESREAKAA